MNKKIILKKCYGRNSCGKEKPLKDFPRNSYYPDGHNNRCKACVYAAKTPSSAKKCNPYEVVSVTHDGCMGNFTIRTPEGGRMMIRVIAHDQQHAEIRASQHVEGMNKRLIENQPGKGSRNHINIATKPGRPIKRVKELS